VNISDGSFSVNSEVGRMWVVTFYDTIPIIFLEELSKITKNVRIGGHLAVNRMPDPPTPTHERLLRTTLTYFVMFMLLTDTSSV
jgi:hypothetical protein